MIKVMKADGQPELQIVWSEVYAPDRPDADGEFMAADEIQKMAYAFMRKSDMGCIDVQHDNEIVNDCRIVESFIARKNDPDFIEGAWVIGLHIPNPGLWDKVKKGELNGFSMEAAVFKQTVEVAIEIPPVVTGLTSVAKAEDGVDHEHKFYVTYDASGDFVGGVTDTVAGHLHAIKAGTHTEPALGHTHRFSSVDNVRIVAQ